MLQGPQTNRSSVRKALEDLPIPPERSRPPATLCTGVGDNLIDHKPLRQIIDFAMSERSAVPQRSGSLSRAGASRSHPLTWALLRFLQVIKKTKRVGRSVS